MERITPKPTSAQWTAEFRRMFDLTRVELERACALAEEYPDTAPLSWEHFRVQREVTNRVLAERKQSMEKETT